MIWATRYVQGSGALKSVDDGSEGCVKRPNVNVVELPGNVGGCLAPILDNREIADLERSIGQAAFQRVKMSLAADHVADDGLGPLEIEEGPLKDHGVSPVSALVRKPTNA